MPLRRNHPGESAMRTMTTDPSSGQGRPMAASLGHPADGSSLLLSCDSELSAPFVNNLLPTASLVTCRKSPRPQHSGPTNVRMFKFQRL